MTNHVKEYRKAAGYTQQQLAEITGISRRALSSIENDAAVPSVEIALKLAFELGVKTENIFELDKRQKP